MTLYSFDTVYTTFSRWSCAHALYLIPCRGAVCAPPRLAQGRRIHSNTNPNLLSALLLSRISSYLPLSSLLRRHLTVTRGTNVFDTTSLHDNAEANPNHHFSLRLLEIDPSPFCSSHTSYYKVSVLCTTCTHLDDRNALSIHI